MMYFSRDQLAQAGRVVDSAQLRLVQFYPYHSHLITSWAVFATGGIGTMGVTDVEGRVKLFFNPEFVLTCTEEEIIGVLHHEVNHILLGHLSMSPESFPDRQALMIAQELSANEWIRGEGEKLPPNGITLSRFPKLPPQESTETRYHRLEGKVGNPNHQCLIPGRWLPSNSRDDSEPSGVVPLDDHGLWQNPDLSKQLEQMSTRVWLPSSQDRVNDGTSYPPPGGLPGHPSDSLDSGVKGKLNWRWLLEPYRMRSLKVQPVFSRPPRRFPQLVGIVPGRQHRPQRISVMAVIDTSSSMKLPVLNAIGAEIELIAEGHEVTVVECDAAVQQVYPFRSRISTVQGRGDTNFQPALAADLLNKIRPDVVVYFTDGGGTAPNLPPPVPVIWCLTPLGQKPINWGRSVTLPPVPRG